MAEKQTNEEIKEWKVKSIINTSEWKVKDKLTVDELKTIKETFNRETLSTRKETWRQLQELLIKTWEWLKLDTIVDRKWKQLWEKDGYSVEDSLRSWRLLDLKNKDFTNFAKKQNVATDVADWYVWNRTLHTIDALINSLEKKQTESENANAIETSSSWVELNNWKKLIWEIKHYVEEYLSKDTEANKKVLALIEIKNRINKKENLQLLNDDDKKDLIKLLKPIEKENWVWEIIKNLETQDFMSRLSQTLKDYNMKIEWEEIKTTLWYSIWKIEKDDYIENNIQEKSVIIKTKDGSQKLTLNDKWWELIRNNEPFKIFYEEIPKIDNNNVDWIIGQVNSKWLNWWYWIFTWWKLVALSLREWKLYNKSITWASWEEYFDKVTWKWEKVVEWGVAWNVQENSVFDKNRDVVSYIAEIKKLNINDSFINMLYSENWAERKIPVEKDDYYNITQITEDKHPDLYKKYVETFEWVKMMNNQDTKSTIEVKWTWWPWKKLSTQDW